MPAHILVVDDRPDSIREAVELIRQSPLDAKVYTAPNGAIALELANTLSLDLILTDWEMPVMSGLELVQALAAAPRTAAIPVIVFTAIRTDDESLSQAFTAGVRDFLRKPFSALELHARIRNTLALEASLAASREQATLIEQQRRQLERRLQAEESAGRLKDKLFAVVAHDLRGPMANLTTLAQIEATMPANFSPAQRADLDRRLLLRLQAAVATLENVLQWSMLTLSGQVQTEHTSLAAAVEEVITLYAEDAKQKGLTLHQELPDGLHVATQPGLLTFALRNFVSNAVKFSPIGARITLRAWDEDPVRIEVEDQGAGMDAKRALGISDGQPLFALPGTIDECGTGIGLSLVHDFLTQAGGTLSVDSAPGAGTRITVCLPAVVR